ncbi:unnamed protein product [Cylicocyclus nassatus]|uniref:Uncharacterized protein n=1 Tax=Cylicocyclus nassatus TaxID=53992 RepID=A0AA36GPM1_CYLNA|nr:unnamed protein product [Cylicocyclus nassatus]
MENSTRQIQHTPPKPRRLVDNAAEVRRRKEAAERLIKERHEALRRQHEEKIHKINEERMRLQRELKERHAKELKRQQDVLQRRMALMERDKARKQEILEKNHAVASRLSTNSSRKNYAFGSSTPRELSFLDPRILKMSAMEKRYSPDKQQSPPNGAVNVSAINARRGRSMASVLSTSLYDHSNQDRTRHTASTTRLTQPKTTPPKPQNHMTQSVYHPAPTPTTPVARLRRKPLSQVTNSVPNTPLAGNNAPATPKRFEKSKNARNTTPKHVANKKAPTPPPAGSTSPQRKESLARSDDISTPLGVTASEPPRSENSFTSDEIPIDMAEKEVHYEISVDSPPAEMHHHEITPNGAENHDVHENPSEAEETTLVNEVDVVIEPPAAVINHAEQASEEEAVAATFTKDVVITSPTPAADEQLISPVPKSSDVEAIPVAEIASPLIAAPAPQEGGASLADELASVFGGSTPAVAHEQNDVQQPPVIVEPPSVDMSAVIQAAENALLTLTKAQEAPLVETAPEKAMETPAAKKSAEIAHAEMPSEKAEVEKPVGKVSYENPLIDFSTAGEEERNKSPSSISAEPVHTEVINHVHTNGIEHKAHPEIAAELPGTVPSKDGDASVMRKVPTPPNDFLISTQAHRLRREQEQREIDERKARIAAILAKSRDLSSGAPVVGGRISPPRGETAQDVLKRLATTSNRSDRSRGSSPAGNLVLLSSAFASDCYYSTGFLLIFVLHLIAFR